MNLGWVSISDIDPNFLIALKEASIEVKPDTKYNLWVLTMLMSSQAYFVKRIHSLPKLPSQQWLSG